MIEPMFYCAPLPPVGERAQLRGDEARHAGAARRLQPGDTLWLFDGSGGVARAQLHARTRRSLELQATIVERQQWPRPQPEVHLVSALPKGDRAAVMLDMATQLGLQAFTPLLCERSIVKPGAGALERLRRVCLEACKQCRRAYVPEINAPADLDTIVTRDTDTWIAHPDGKPMHELVRASSHPLTIVVGPEGGFSDDELARATARGFIRVALGAGILRVETAAVALLATAMLNARGPT